MPHKPRYSIDTTDYDQVYEQVPPSPEKRLLIAVIQRAVYDYANPIKGRINISYEAAAWLFSDSQTIMSLWWVCQVLSEFPDSLKMQIQRSAKSGKFKPNSVIFRVDTR